MSELKTLKDLERDWKGRPIYFKNEIKAEAIKWAKHWNLRYKQLKELDGKNDYNTGYFKGMRDEVMIANNLTEDELK